MNTSTLPRSIRGSGLVLSMHRDRLLFGGLLPLNEAIGPMKIVTIIARILLGLLFFVLA